MKLLSLQKAEMLRVVLDTNVIISGVIMPSGIPFSILKKWEKGEFTLIMSDSILEEITTVFFRPKIKKYISVENVETTISLFKNYSLMVPEELDVKIELDDPKDKKFLVVAIEGDADFIVSGDKHLKDLGFYQKVRIISPNEFLRQF